MTKNMIIKGEKLLVKEFSIQDIDDAYIGWLNDPIVVRYSNQRFLKHTKETCVKYWESFDSLSRFFFILEENGDKKNIGTMTVYISKEHGIADMGIMIGDKAVWGQAYGQDAWNTVAAWLFDLKKIRKITAGTNSCNKAMIKIMERSGMKLEATKVMQECIDGEYVDVLYYAKFNRI